jgi:RimJ/RimL family protein N-acetyltransferase
MDEESMNFWQGTHVRLRAVEPSDAEAFFTWNQDSEMGRNLDQVWVPTSRESVNRWVEEEAIRKKGEDDAFRWVIENGAGEFVGSIDTHHCDRRTGTFQYGVAVRREHQRKGYATETILMVLRYFFEELRYQKVMVHVHSDNVPSARLHEQLGFQLEGRLRRTVYTGGQYWDDLVFGMTIEEFHATHPGASAR